MEAVASANQIELYGVSQVVPYLMGLCGPKTAVYPIGDEFSQRIRGDYIFFSLVTERAQTVDVKSEEKATPHLFIETQSDRHGDPCRGWLLDLHPDTTLAYFVIETRKLYLVRMGAIRKWLYERVQYADGSFGPRINRFREREQSKRQQRNVTVGRLVPVVEFLTIRGAEEHDVPEVTSGL